MGQATRSWLALMVVTTFFFSLAVWHAPPASAHHPEITASSYCDEADRPIIDYTAFSWLQDPDRDGESGNPDIGIYVDGAKVDGGAFVSPDYEFGGVIDATRWAGSTVTVMARADAPFNNGSSRGSSRSTTVTVPADCAPTSTSVVVSVGACEFGEVATRPVTVTLGEGVVSVSVVGAAGVEQTITSSGVLDLVSGSYSWSAVLEPGYTLGEVDKTFEVAPCPLTETEVTVTTGACAYSQGLSSTPVSFDFGVGVLVVSVTGPGEFSVELTLPDDLELPPGDYTWVAEAAPGYELDVTRGTLTVADCPPTPITTTTAAPPQLGALGDYVWADADKDGVQDADELPVAGTKVELLHNDVVIETTTTAIDGRYLFDELPAGSYQVRFTAPSGYLGFTLPNQGSDAEDSDAIAADGSLVGTTGLIVLGEGQIDLTNDAGLIVEVGAVVVTTTTTTSAPTTTVPPVTASTLPFTGFGEQALMLLSLFLVAAGALFLAAGSDEQAARVVHGRWEGR